MLFNPKPGSLSCHSAFDADDSYGLQEPQVDDADQTEPGDWWDHVPAIPHAALWGDCVLRYHIHGTGQNSILLSRLNSLFPT